MPIAFLDGQFIEKDQIRLSPVDYGFARGLTIFEMTRVYGTAAFRLDDHIERFALGAKKLGVTLPYTAAEITQAVSHIAVQNKIPHSGMKFYLTMGECGSPGGFGFVNATNFTPHLIMMQDAFTCEHPDAPRGLEFCQRGIALKLVPFSRQIADVKTINYAPGFRAAQLLAGSEFVEILYTHQDGMVTETTTSNFFCVIDGVLCTPGREMLYGVTRKVLLELAAKIGLPVAERDIKPAELLRATEAFISGSLIEMIPVRLVDDMKIPSTTNGPVYTKLRQALSAYIKTVVGNG